MPNSLLTVPALRLLLALAKLLPCQPKVVRWARLQVKVSPWARWKVDKCSREVRRCHAESMKWTQSLEM